MRKIAVFVEGQTELIVTRELLLRCNEYNVSIQCWQLHAGELRSAEYDFENPNASVFYQLVNVGNDRKVLSAILERESSIFSNGFEKIIGLRDMYSKAYREMSNTINNELNQKIIADDQAIIEKRTANHNRIFFCFSIMEIEAWFLAMPAVFVALNGQLTVDFISQQLGFNLDEINPETTFFHPAQVMNEVYGLNDMTYDKDKGSIEAICALLEVQHYQDLHSSSNCQSFNLYFDNLL